MLASPGPRAGAGARPASFRFALCAILAVLALAAVLPFGVRQRLLPPCIHSLDALRLAGFPAASGSHVYVLEAAGNSSATWGAFKQMQQQLGGDNVFLVIDDAKAQVTTTTPGSATCVSYLLCGLRLGLCIHSAGGGCVGNFLQTLEI